MNETSSVQSASWQERWEHFKPYAPFVAFICGFGFDSFTLGRSVDPIDLYIVSFYAVGALLGLVAREVDLPEIAQRLASLVLQFALGGSLSALVVLYFKSTGQPLALMLVLAIFATAVVNEILHIDEPPQREWVVSIWAVSATMLANFVLPHIVGSVSVLWFYGSAVAVAGILVGLRFLFHFEWRSLRYALGALAALVGLWIVGAVPPVPLVMKNNLVCTDYDKEGGEYTCRTDATSLLQRVGITSPQVTSNDEPVYCLTAVFAPDAVGVVLEHRWYRLDDEGDWEQTDTMNFEMTGGREDGWRFWSRKRNIAPGWWKIETALPGGGVLGYEKFEVVEGAAEKTREAL